LGLLVILTGCPKTAKREDVIKPKGMVYFTFFDTVSYVYSYKGDTQKEFEKRCQEVSDILSEYHALFNIYYDFEGVSNLKAVNDNAGREPVKVDRKLIDFLLYAKQLHEATSGEMNVMMGSVLKLWHDCRSEAGTSPSKARIPTADELNEAAKHTDISLLEIDEENLTVFISDPKASIDVGALGKGYATEKAAEHLRSVGADSYVLNIGGNIRIIGHKQDGGSWGTGIKDPADTSRYATVIDIADTSCVTSGDYERFFSVNGKKYHHIIDKDTLMPSEYFSSVTIITPDSGLADALSTALFSMSYEDGLRLISAMSTKVEVLWIFPNGEMRMSDGFKTLQSTKQQKTLLYIQE
jgi:thiamine biosynthesis lipoprotein